MQPYAVTFSISMVENEEEINILRISYTGFPQPHPSGSPNRFPSGYTISQVFNYYGPPDIILILPSKPNLSMALIYYEPTLTIEYLWQPQYDNNYSSESGLLHFCPTTGYLFGLDIYALSQQEQEVFIASYSQNALEIEDISQYSVESYTEAVLKDPNTCFELEDGN